MLTEAKYGIKKVNQKHLSKLMCWILLHTDDGIERSTIAEGYYQLSRRYCGWYTDPCLRPKEKRSYERRYRKVQPVVTKALYRLEKRGLVQLLRHGCYVKEIRLTAAGKLTAQQLKKMKV